MHGRLLLLVAVVLVLPTACGSTNPDASTAEYEDLAGPLLVATVDGGDMDSTWDDLRSASADLDQLGDRGGEIPAFEPFNDPRIVLSDGRFVVRGRWLNDAPVAGWYQRNPALVAHGDVNPILDNVQRPIRLFIYDPSAGEVTPVSHVPDVRPFSTAVLVGASPDAVLDVVVLSGERAVAYRSGFSGAAYDIPREIYVAPLPQG